MLLVLKYLWIKVWISGKKIKLEGQFGIGTNMGLRKAWDAIMEKIDTPTIFEFDLEKFYDNVTWAKYLLEMKEMGLPSNLTSWISTAIRHSQLEQHPHKIMEDLERLVKTPRLIDCLRSMGIIPGLVEYISRKITWRLDMRELKWRLKSTVYHDSPELTGGLKPRFAIRVDPAPSRITMGKRDQRGVPQGLTMGGFAACTALRDVYEEFKGKLIMYVDDGLLMGNYDPLNLIRFSGYLMGSGVYISPNKSGYVKRNGVWLKPLKFLGLVYDGRTGKIRASTRSGTNTEYPELNKLIEKLEAMGYHNIRGDTMTNWWIANRLELSDFMLAYIFNKGRLNPKQDGGTLKNERQHQESFLSHLERIRSDLTRTNSTSLMVPLLKRMHEKRRIWTISAKHKDTFLDILSQISHD